MTSHQQSQVHDPYRWSTIFAVLSLDLTAPYIPQAGLELPHREAFREHLREIIRQFRELQKQDQAARLPFTETVFEWVREEFGTAFSLHLQDWGENVFQYGNGIGASVFLWNNIVRHGGLDGSRDSDLAPPSFVRKLRAHLAEHLTPTLLREPTTEWDKELYARQGYDKLMNPSEFVISTISYYNFVLAWRETVTDCESPPDLGPTYMWAQEVGRRLGMPVDRIGQPGAWPELPKPLKTYT